MAHVYMRVATSGMPKGTLRSILNNLHGTGNKPLLTAEPIGDSWFVRFDDNAGATRAAVMGVIESMFVHCEAVAGLPGNRRLEWSRGSQQSRQRPPHVASRAGYSPAPAGSAEALLLAMIGTPPFAFEEDPRVREARVRSEVAAFRAQERIFDSLA